MIEEKVFTFYVFMCPPISMEYAISTTLYSEMIPEVPIRFSSMWWYNHWSLCYSKTSGLLLDTRNLADQTIDTWEILYFIEVVAIILVKPWVQVMKKVTLCTW